MALINCKKASAGAFNYQYLHNSVTSQAAGHVMAVKSMLGTTPPSLTVNGSGVTATHTESLTQGGITTNNLYVYEFDVNVGDTIAGTGEGYMIYLA